MPIILDDATALLLLQHFLTSKSPPSGTGLAILGIVQDSRKLLQQLQQGLQSMSETTQTTDQQFQTELAGLRDDVAKQTTTANGLKVLVAGIVQKLTDAEAHAQAAGATPSELSALRAIRTDLAANTQAMVDAAAQGTTSQGEAPAPVEPTTTVPPSVVQDPTTATTTGGTEATVTVDDSGTKPAA